MTDDETALRPRRFSVLLLFWIGAVASSYLGYKLHAWWVPALGVKQDAIPGFARDSWFKAEKRFVLRLPMIGDLASILANVDFWSAVLRIATPLVLGTLGVLLCERAGVLNLGIEGIMVAGALAGWIAVYEGANLWVGVLAAALCVAAMALATAAIIGLHVVSPAP